MLWYLKHPLTEYNVNVSRSTTLNDFPVKVDTVYNMSAAQYARSMDGTPGVIAFYIQGLSITSLQTENASDYHCSVYKCIDIDTNMSFQ